MNDAAIATIFKFGILLVGVFIVSVTSCTMYESALVVRGIEYGADPLRMKCAMNPGGIHQSICTVLASQEPRAKP